MFRIESGIWSLVGRFHFLNNIISFCFNEDGGRLFTITADRILTEFKINQDNRKSGFMILTEGKYHEIKRICGYLGKKVTFLERVRFGGLSIDTSLDRGAWRHMTKDEIALLDGK